MTRKVLMEGLRTNIPDLKEPCPICPNTDVSKFASGFMFYMDFAFFNIESIRGFTSTFVVVCSATSHLFGFPSRIKRPHLDILKLLVTAFMNQDDKI